MAIQGYEVDFKKNDSAVWNRKSRLVQCKKESTYLWNVLGAGNDYNVRVRALSSVDTNHGPWSDLQTESTYASELVLHAVNDKIAYTCIMQQQ